VGAVSAEEYAGLVGELLDFLAGDTSPILDRLDKQMHGASDALEFERAARLRDQIVMVRKAIERQQMVDAREEDYDAIGIVDDELEASVQVFLVRKGRVVGRKGLVVDKVEDVTRAELVGRLLEQLYGDGGPAGASEVPREILVPEEPEDRPLYEEFLGAVRESNGRSAPAGPQGGTKVGTKASGKVGTKVRVRVPQRGAKRALLETVTQNAAEAFTRHKLRRATDHNARARALVALQDALGLPEAPLRIECYDISNLQGTEIVASMVVMEDGLPKRSDYRRFRLRHQEGQDDFASMEEVLTRRFRRYLAERTGRTDPTEGDDRTEGGEDVEPGTTGTTAVKKFAYPPNLVLIDGGKGQLGVAARVLAELGLDGIAVAGLAKRFEEVYVPGESEPVRIGRDSEALYLLQQIRDEAHRFAITYHRQLRGRSMTRSVLDDVPGLGPVRRARLLKEHGSVKRLRALTEEELVAIPWLPEAVGRAVFAHLHGLAAPASTPAGPGA
jgi:excinuclease ABC subunit C